MKSQFTFLWLFLLMLSTSIVYSQAQLTPVAGQTESFDVSQGDFFYDPGGPGGSSTGGTPGNYPNCGCITVTTLNGATEIEFLFFSVFATFDWLRIYDGEDTSGPVLFDNNTGGANSGDITLADMIASNGSAIFTGTSGSLTFEFRSSTVVDYGGWEVEILAASGGGGGGGGEDSDVENDLCADAIPVTCGETITGTSANSNTNTLPACNLAPYGGGIWYSIEGTGGDIEVTTCSATTNFDTQIGIFTGSCTSLSCVAGNNNDPSCANGRQSTVTFTSDAETTYYIYLTGTAGARGNFAMTVTCLADPDTNCLNDDQWPSSAVTAPANGLSKTISSCNFAGEYAIISNITSGSDYRFTSSVSTDYFTIREGAVNGPVIGAGVSPLTVTANSSSNLYMHLNTNVDCGAQNSCRTTSVCTNCVTVVGCANTTSFLSNPAPTTTDVATLTTCLFPQEYTTVTNAQSTSTYLITASVGSNFITVRQGTPTGTIIGTGTGSVTVTPTANNVNLYIHLNTNSNCGTATGCNTMTIQCTTCIPPVSPDCAGAVALGCGDTVSGSTLDANVNSVPDCGGLDASVAPGVWYAFSSASNVEATLVACGNFNVQMAIYSGSCSDLECVASSLESAPGKPCAGAGSGRNRESIAVFDAFAGETYYVYVTGGVGLGAAGDFTLSVASCEIFLQNDDCANALPIACGETIVGSTTGATSESLSFCGTSLSSAPGVWYSFVGTGGDATASLCASSYDTKIGIFSGTCGALVCEDGNDDACGTRSEVTFGTTAGTTYYIYVTGFSSNAGAFTLNVECGVPPVETYPGCFSATSLTCGGSVTGSNVGAPVNSAAPFCNTSLTTAGGKWHTIVGTGETIQVTTCNPGTNYDTKLGVFTGTCAGLTCVAGNDDGSPGGGQDPACFTVAGTNFNRASTVTFASTAGTTYYILVTGFGTGATSTGSYELSASCTSTLIPNTINSRSEEKKIYADDVSDITLNVGNFFPNPVTTSTVMIQIDSPSNTEGMINVVDQTGRIVDSNKLFLGKGTNNTEVDVTNLPAGTYIATIVVDSEITQRKFVVIK